MDSRELLLRDGGLSLCRHSPATTHWSKPCARSITADNKSTDGCRTEDRSVPRPVIQDNPQTKGREWRIRN